MQVMTKQTVPFDPCLTRSRCHPRTYVPHSKLEPLSTSPAERVSLREATLAVSSGINYIRVASLPAPYILYDRSLERLACQKICQNRLIRFFRPDGEVRRGPFEPSLGRTTSKNNDVSSFDE